MSMRIEGQTDVKVLDNIRFTGSKNTGSESTMAHTADMAQGSDNVSLSSASELVSLAKTLMPADKQQKIAALTARVRSGEYRPDSSRTSRAIVQGFLRK